MENHVDSSFLKNHNITNDVVLPSFNIFVIGSGYEFVVEWQ
jgi:hypothetical protein